MKIKFLKEEINKSPKEIQEKIENEKTVEEKK